jgi:hypothetical protein
MRRRLLIGLMAATGAAGQTLSWGVKAGVPVNLPLAAAPGHRAGTQRYTVGPMLELALLRGWSAAFDVLYKRFNYAAPGISERTAGRWEFPLQARYSPGKRFPFVGAGIAWNYVTGSGFPGIELRHRSTKGLLASSGVTFPAGPLRLIPELRLTRWTDRNFGVRDAPLRSNLTQIELLVGIAF